MLRRSRLLLALGFVLLCQPAEGQGVVSIRDRPAWLPSSTTLQNDPWSDGIAGTGLLLRRLDGAKRVLMVGAHPDDEDTALLTALARGMGAETAYLSLTRGEGGQNLIGPELDEGLGLVRTGELLAARTLDGGRQFFTRAFDFGYSKTAEETFRYWPREEVLSDVTWVVRTFRPHVVISVFSGTPRDGHGHHHVAGILTREVFQAAGDPSRFPEQLAAGAEPWQPSKLYRLTRRNPDEGTTGIETGVLDPLLGRSYFQIAMESRSQHRSQDMGMPQPLGPRRSTVALVESRVQVQGRDEIFAGVDTALVEMAAGLPSPIRRRVTRHLRAYRDAIAEARSALRVTDPWGAAPHLGRGLVSLREALVEVEKAPVHSGGTERASDLLFTLRHRLPLVQVALLRSAGVVVEVTVDRQLLVPGETVGGVVELWNGGPHILEGVQAHLAVPEDWQVEGEVEEARTVAPRSLVRWSFRLQVPVDEEASVPYYLSRPREGGLYRWPEERELWAMPADPPLVQARVKGSMVDVEEVEVWAPGRYRGVDKATGAFVEPLQVVPALAVSLDPSSMAWPSTGGDSRAVQLTVRSHTGNAVSGEAELVAPGGWRVDPPARPFSLSGPGGEIVMTFLVHPPADLEEEKISLKGRVRTSRGDTYRHDVVLVDHPHIPGGALFPPAEAVVSLFPLDLPEGLRVGYVMGSGDEGPEAIRQMGARVDLLGSEAVRGMDLTVFDAVVLGIRAYETRPDLLAANDRFLEYVREGGTLIVQYNKYEYPRLGVTPFPVGMARPHDRVTDETASVRILQPSHAVFNRPNAIGPADFEGWVQERGLYFLRSWDADAPPLLEMADPGEEPKPGSLLVARVGEGHYVYTGLSFFRQFPEGVPGAYRLFANLLSLEPEGPPREDGGRDDVR